MQTQPLFRTPSHQFWLPQFAKPVRKAHPDSLNTGKETGWVNSILARDIPLVDRPEIGEDLISNIS